MDQPARRVAYGSLNSECRCLKLVDTFRRRHRTNPPRRYVAECRKVGNNRTKSRGRDRRPQGEQRGLAAAPAPVPAGASQGYGEMVKQHPAR